MNGAYSLWAGPDELVTQLIEAYLASGHRGGRERAQRCARQHIKSHVVNVPYAQELQEGAAPFTESPPAFITTGHAGQCLNVSMDYVVNSDSQQQHKAGEQKPSHPTHRGRDFI